VRGPVFTPVRISVPSRSDGLLKGLTEVVGGPLGRRTAPGVVDPGFFTVERVLVLLTTVAALLSVLVKMPCRAAGWAAPDHFYRACYSDWPELFTSRGLGEGALPFTGAEPFEYPVLLGLFAGGTALLAAWSAGEAAWLAGEAGGTPGGGPVGTPGIAQAEALRYFDLNATLAVAAWIATVIVTARMANRRPWDAAMVAVAPGIVLAGTINWDLWAALLAALGMLAFARNQPVLAGIFIGLGAAFKVYPVLILGAVLLLALRTGKTRAPLQAVGAAAGAWLAVNLPFMLRDYGAWRYFLDFSAAREAGFSSPWFIFNAISEEAGRPVLGPEAVNRWALLAFALACAAIAVLALAAPRRPRLVQLAFLIVASFVLANKVYSPQFVVWLVPLAALAWPRWRDFLIWQFFEVLHWWALWMYLGWRTGGGEAAHNIDTPYYLLAVCGHLLGTGYLMYRVAESVVVPTRDPVRRLDIDDPQGGPFDRAPDRWRLRVPARWPALAGSRSGRLGSVPAPAKEPK
jgi:hypothetical protein